MMVLDTAAYMALAVGGLSAAWIVSHEWRHRQTMWIMYPVWPLVALSGGPLIVWLYHRAAARLRAPFWLATAVATCHCGAGCTLGDLVAETLATTHPAILVPFGLGWATQQPIFAGWGLDFALAYAIGIVFQYFSIAPMRHLGLGDGLVAALKADTLSLVGWQLGMYGAMAVVQFLLLPAVIGHPVTASSPVFWFAMQGAMIAGFATSYPVNILLLRLGWKERM
ncbi:MAG: DUF4396 domain-containing protein [Proteobacteria bacterium]|nr:DUF4396 domain-containing protein [Pseudomonadota bacterium]